MIFENLCTREHRYLAVLLFEQSQHKEASLMAQMVKNLPAMQEIQVQSLGWEDPLEREMSTHSSILVWRISWKRSLVGYSP